MRTRSRHAFSGLVAIVLALSLTACGQGATSTATKSGADASAAAGASKTPGEMSLKDFAAAMASNQTGQSYHTDMVIDMVAKAGKTSIRASGDYGPTPAGPGLRMTMETPMGKIKVIMIGKDFYMLMPFMTDKWQKMDQKSAEEAQAGSDPEAYVKMLESASKVEFIGNEDVDGQSADHYKVTLPKEAVAKAQGTPLEALKSISDDIVYDIWLNGAKQPVKMVNKMTMDGQGLTTTVTFSNYGQEVTIKAPPANRVVDFKMP